MMKQTLALIVIFIISCSNQLKISEQKLSLKSYNLKGNVEYFSDKKIPSRLIDNNWKTQIDTLHLTSLSYQNKYFDKNGFLTNIKYYDKDSSLLIDSRILFSKSGNYQGTKDFDKNGEQLTYTKIIDSDTNFLAIEIYDYNSGKLISRSKTEYENYLVKTQYSESINQRDKSKYIYKRDPKGNEVETLMRIEWGNQKSENISFTQYLDFDESGNWTKRIDYNNEKGDECLVTIRKIKYYE